MTVIELLIKTRYWQYGIIGCLFISDIITTTIALNLGYPELNVNMAPYVSDPFQHLIVKIIAFSVFVGLIEAITFILKKMERYHKINDSIFAIAIFVGILIYLLTVIGNVFVILFGSNSGL